MPHAARRPRPARLRRAASRTFAMAAVGAVVLGAIGTSGCRERRAGPLRVDGSAEAGALSPPGSRVPSGASDAAPEPATAPPTRAASRPPERLRPFDPAASGEARRTVVPRLEADPLLRAQLPVLREHFGAGAAGPFDVARAELPGGRTALLVSRDGEKEPMVLVVDRDALAWTKPRPAAGMVPPVEHLAIAPRPDGGVAIFGWVSALGLVASRMWADDGSAFGDFEVFAPDACDALSVASAPGAGWIIACAAASGSRAARLREDATAAWGKRGVPVGSGSANGPIAMAFDSGATFLLFERAAAVGGDRLLALRYAVSDGAPLWDAPVDLGVMSRAGDGGRGGRPAAVAVREGLVRVVGGAGPHPVDIASDGGTRPSSAPAR